MEFMKQIIFVTTTPERVEVITNFLHSMREYSGKYSLFIQSGYEYNQFEFARDHQFDEILTLNDSIEIKDYSLFDLIFETYKGKSVSFTGHPYFLMDMGKFKREPYLQAAYEGSETYIGRGTHEYLFGTKYCECAKEEPVVLFPDLLEPERKVNVTNHWVTYETKFGRKNMILENQYIKKYKGHWTGGMMRSADRNGL